MMNKTILLSLAVIALICGVVFWLRPDANESIIANVPPRTNDGEVVIVAFGDSLTAGYGLPAQEAYPAQLEARLEAQGKSVRVINSGVSGETTKGNLERAEFIRRQNPDIVLLGIGGNDALRQLPVPAAKSNIAETITILKSGENPPVIVLLQMQAPLNAGLAYKREFDNMYETLAQEEQVLLVPFLTTEVFLNIENKLPDGIHLNGTGYQIVVDEYILPTLVPLIDQLTST